MSGIHPDFTMEQKIIVYPIIAIALLLQGTFIFLSAKKRGKNAWFWGFIGLLNIPSGLIWYYIFVIYPEKKKERKK